jgi:membrane-associated protease RseP (regulator of RpoE activity)
LPVPMLDGGHLIFYAAEGSAGVPSVKGRRTGHFAAASPCFSRSFFSLQSTTWPLSACSNDLDA